MFRAHFSRAEGEAAAPVAVQVTILRDTLGILIVPTIPTPFPPSPFTHPRSGTVMLVRATASLQALVSIPLLDAKLKIRASGLMLGFMQTSASSSDASSSSSLALLAPKSSKFVLRFTARADLLTFVAALRDAGARVNGDAAAHQKAEPVDVKPALDLSSSQLFASSQLSQSASCTVTVTGTGGVGVAAANPAVVGKRKAASDELALPTPAFARMSSMSSSYHQHSSQSTQTAARRERDENAPTNQFAAPPPLSLLQRVAAVMAAPDFEAQVASVERALSILRQSSV